MKTRMTFAVLLSLFVMAAGLLGFVATVGSARAFDAAYDAYMESGMTTAQDEFGFAQASVTRLIGMFAARYRVAFLLTGFVLLLVCLSTIRLNKLNAGHFLRPAYPGLKIAFTAAVCLSLVLLIGAYVSKYAAPRFLDNQKTGAKLDTVKNAVTDGAAVKKTYGGVTAALDAWDDYAKDTGDAADEAMYAMLMRAQAAGTAARAGDAIERIENAARRLDEAPVSQAEQALIEAGEATPAIAEEVIKIAVAAREYALTIDETIASDAEIPLSDCKAALKTAKSAYAKADEAQIDKARAAYRGVAVNYTLTAMAELRANLLAVADNLDRAAAGIEGAAKRFDTYAALCGFMRTVGAWYMPMLAAAVLLLVSSAVCFLASGYAFNFWITISVIILLLLGIFLLYPFSSLITRSFFSKKVDGVTLYNYQRFFNSKYYLTALKNSAFVTFATTVTCCLIGIPVAYLMTRYNVWGKKLFYVFIILALMSPPFIGAYSWILLFGRAGFATRLFAAIGITTPTIYGKPGIILVFTLHLYPYMYLYVSGAMSSIDSSLEEAGENLGSAPLRRIFTITLPVILPSILAGCVMVFMSTLADFGTPQLIGEGYNVLSVLVYNEYISETGSNANMASMLSVVVVALALIILLAQKIYVSRRNYIMTALRPPQVIEVHGFKRFLVTLPVALITLVGMIPQFMVLAVSFMETEFSGFTGRYNFSNYTSIASRLGLNILNTYKFSIVAIAFIVVFGMLISYVLVRKRGKVSSFIDLLVMFPYVIPGSVLGVCLIVAFNRKPLILTGTAAIMIISYIVRKLPYTVRSGSAFLYQSDPSIEEASINLGVSPMKTFFTVVARLMLPGILSGAILSWITCINELSSSIMLYSANTSTISVAIYQEVMRMSDGTAAALSTILSLTTVISLLIFFRVSKGRVSIV